jgi:2-iminobutanoate/2-iminopropanoate deaminase
MHRPVRASLWVTSALLLLAAGSSAAQERRYFTPLLASDTATRPFSGAVLVGNTLYLSGTIGVLPGPKVPDTPTEEAHLVLDNVKKALADAGMTMDDLVSVQVFCSDLSTYAEFNKVYRTYFTKEYPARAFLGVAHVLFGARFEVQAIAVKR